MKIDKFLKDKFVYTKGHNPIKSIYFFAQKYLKNKPKKSYSGGGVDLLINYFFRNKTNGIYLDIGCYHPFQGSNTYLLHKKGWRGINIDLDEGSIDLFNHFRKKDYNKKIALSDKKGEITVHSYHNRSAVQTVDKEILKKMDKTVLNSFKVKCDLLNNVIEESPFKDDKIDFLSIDIEGHELTVLKEFNFKKYDPSIIVIEYIELELKTLEFHYQKIENILNSSIYKFMDEKGYRFVNWHHSDLIFVSSKIFNKREVIGE
jgi:FkbM family methyltransferase